MSDFWTKILAFIENFLSGAEAIALSSLIAGAQDLAKNGGALLISAADAAVQAAESSNKPGAEKFQDALAAVKGTLENAGEPIVEHAVQLAVITAVSRLRALP